jgi:hypothetical protein
VTKEKNVIKKSSCKKTHVLVGADDDSGDVLFIILMCITSRG